jgi:hypothetical protein
MTEPKKYGIIVVDIEDDKITDAQYKITDVDAEPKPVTTGYSPIDIKDLATASVTAPVTGGPPILPEPEPTNSKSENTWPKELEPATYENIKNIKNLKTKKTFYLVKSKKDNPTEDGEASEEGKKITTLELLKKQTIPTPTTTAAPAPATTAAPAPATAADYKTGIEKLLFRKIDIVNVQRTAKGRIGYGITMARNAIGRRNAIPDEIQVDFNIPGKITQIIKTTVTTTGDLNSLLKIKKIEGVTSLPDEYVIYQPVGNEDLLSISKLAEGDADLAVINEAVTSLSTISGGAKKLSKKNNLKTKNRRNRSKRKSLKRITRKIRHT